MAKELMRSVSQKNRFMLDPRTKLLLVFTSSAILISGSPGGIMDLIRPVLSFLPLVLFALMGRWKASLKFAALYTAAYLVGSFVLPNAGGLIGFMAAAVIGIFTRFLPCLAMGSYLVSTTTVSGFIASMERMHVPQCIVIPFSVMFRFFPTIGEESKSINDAMRMRGIGFAGAIKNPMAMLEYRLVPLMMSVVKIGEELSAASLTRGLGSPVKRTNICKIGFGVLDFSLFALTIFCWIGMLIQ